ncbi:carboxymuconolactone decarboxylase family protein [Comamonas sp.]|uniref:carboxymuconolactone decarboxylase family protein n=1 Tax=Comamonas sp. TaxID=34028 RepID=UPI00258383B3|nr:carboxymuconolactone decarboxylase family protein [Comamonas sp.]
MYTLEDDRLPPIPASAWTPAQQAMAQPIIDGPRGALISPFVPLLRSPELMDHAQRMGEYLRYRSSIGLRLSELAICITARHWSQQVEWAIHAPIAEREGIAPEALKDIAYARRPLALKQDELVLYDFCTELNQNKCVSDATWDAAKKLWGEQGVIDLIGVNGYYSFLSMVMNSARTTVPPSLADPLPCLGK